MKNKQLAYGIHTLMQLLKQAPHQVIEIYIAASKDKINNRCQAIIELAQKNNIAVHSISKAKLDIWCEGAVHQGIAAMIKETEPLTEEQLFNMLQQQKNPLLLILDEVQDPHNLGAILRTADAAKVTAVIVPKDHSVGITPIVRKSASGAVDTVPLVRVSNLARTLQALQEVGVWIVGMAFTAEAKSIFATDLTGAKALVLGAEGKGLRQLTLKHCDHVANIPMLGQIESLNVSVATGICLFEAVRQRHGW